MRRAGDRDVRRCDILGLDAVLGHLVKVRCVHVLVVIPSEAVEGDQQQLRLRVAERHRKDAGGPEETEAPRHGEHLTELHDSPAESRR